MKKFTVTLSEEDLTKLDKCLQLAQKIKTSRLKYFDDILVSDDKSISDNEIKHLAEDIGNQIRSQLKKSFFEE